MQCFLLTNVIILLSISISSTFHLLVSLQISLRSFQALESFEVSRFVILFKWPKIYKKSFCFLLCLYTFIFLCNKLQDLCTIGCPDVRGPIVYIYIYIYIIIYIYLFININRSTKGNVNRNIGRLYFRCTPTHTHHWINKVRGTRTSSEALQLTERASRSLGGCAVYLLFKTCLLNT